MAQQHLNLGSTPDDGRGDQGRIGFDKIEDNFNELYLSKGGLFSIKKKLLATLGDQITTPAASWVADVVANLNLNAGGIATVNLAAPGTGYAVDEILTIIQIGGASGSVKVASITGGGGTGPIDTVTINAAGTGYDVGLNYATTSSGAGTGARFDILTLVPTVQRMEIDEATWVGTGATSIKAQVTALKVITDATPALTPNIIIIFAGGNDSNTSSDFYTTDFATMIGTAYGSLDLTKVGDSVRYNLQTLMTNYPYASIFVILPIIRMDQTYANITGKTTVIKDVAQYMSVNVIDATLESGINFIQETAGDIYLASGGIVPTSAGQTLLGSFITNNLFDKYFPKS